MPCTKIKKKKETNKNQQQNKNQPKKTHKNPPKQAKHTQTTVTKTTTAKTINPKHQKKQEWELLQHHSYSKYQHLFPFFPQNFFFT